MSHHNLSNASIKQRCWQLACLLLAIILLSSCNPALVLPATPTLMPLAMAPQPGSTASPAPNMPSEQVSPATAEFLLMPTPAAPTPIPTATPLVLEEHIAGVKATEAELLFSAPIPPAADVIEWRPPCVPVPHALHPDDHYWLRRPIPSGQVDWGLDWYPYGGNGSGLWRVHHGMDFPNDPGTPVLAAGDGVVIAVMDDWWPMYIELEQEIQPSASESPSDLAAPQAESDQGASTSNKRVVGPYGNFIIIQQDWGWQGQPVYTLYAHLLEIFVAVGDHVKGGDLIAGVGNTGDSTGPHLHFEVRLGENHYNSTCNPALWLAPYEGWGTLAGRVTSAGGMLLDNAVVEVYPVDAEDPTEEERVTTSYANDQVHPDQQWGENFVLPDLPAGDYRLVVHAGGEILRATVTVRAGTTTFIHLHTRLTASSSAGIGSK